VGHVARTREKGNGPREFAEEIAPLTRMLEVADSNIDWDTDYPY
jgi:hypothetical protein